MIIKKRASEIGIDKDELRQLTTVVPFNEKLDDFNRSLSIYDNYPNDITFLEKESFAIVSSEKEPTGVFGFILFDNKEIPSMKDDNVRFHRLSFIELVHELYDYNWLVETFHAIFHRIIKYETQSDVEKREIVWGEIDGQHIVIEMNKTKDLYCNMFMQESQKMANVLTTTILSH